MRVANKPFAALTAEDLMTRDVVTIPQEMTLPTAARLLSRAHISGAPVVDARGVCVGVLSAGDFLSLADREPAGSPAPLCACSDWEMLDLPALPPDEVRHHMTADPVTVTPATRVGELASKMLDAHIHRVIVVNPAGRPIGIVSSTDLIAAIAQTEMAHAVN